MKVRFIEPRSRRGTVYEALIQEWPLLGPVILGTQLKERGHDVVLYNENVTGPVTDEPALVADLCDADFVGISIMTPTAPRGYDIARAIRALSGRPRIAFGGAHATFQPQEAVRYGDFAVQGEAESIIVDLVEGRVPPGIVRGRPVEDLDALPVPDFDLIYQFPRLYQQRRSKAAYRLPLMTSRGCPHGCLYCSVTAMFGRRVRCRSVEKVIQDVRHFYQKGYRSFFFYDDNFTADRERTRQILEGIRDLDIAWNGQVRLDFHWRDPSRRTESDHELLRLMHSAGGDTLYVGYETIEDETARQWNKGYRGAGALAQRAAEDTRILRRAGFWVHGMFILGPQHDHSTAAAIVDFAARTHMEGMQISALTPFPGTKLFEQANGALLFTSYPDDWDLYDGTHALWANMKMGVAEFQRELLRAHVDFYRRTALHLGRLRKGLEGPGGLSVKVRNILDALRKPKQVLGLWEREMEDYLNRPALQHVSISTGEHTK
jgi:anaerobic magnesium-protoporphyrin IX monomethyl ester cyclase